MKKKLFSILLIIFIIFSSGFISYATDDNLEDVDAGTDQSGVNDNSQITESAAVEEEISQNAESVNNSDETNSEQLEEITGTLEDVQVTDNVDVQDNSEQSAVKGLVLEDGKYVYYENGRVNTNFTGLYEQDGVIWYVISGEVDFSYTGTYTDGTGTYVIKKNQVRTDLIGLIELDDWRMVINGKVDYEYTGIGQNQNGMWYIEDGRILYDYTGTYYEGDTAYIIEKNKVCAVVPRDIKRLIEINKEWYMVIDGQIDYDYTGLGENQNGIWYMENGIITYTYTGIYTDETGTYVIKKNQIRTDFTGLMELDDWRMVINGKVDYEYTGIGQNQNGMWYIEDGVILYDYTGTYYEGDTAYIIEKNKVCAVVPSNTTKMLEINKEWYMVIDGQIDYDYTGLGENQNGIWYMENGIITYTYTGTYTDETGTYVIKKNQVRTNFTGLMELDDWRMVINGKVDYEYTGIGQNQNGMWYIEDGVILYDYIGTYYEGDTAYIIEKNKVCVVVPSNTTKMLEINKEWRMVIDGKVDYEYTGIGQNQNGMWYIKDGVILYDYTGTYYEGDTAYIIEKNKVCAVVPRDTKRLIEINKEWYMVIDGQIDYDYTGLGENQNGIWYMENGIITYTYTGIYTDETGTYVIKKNQVRTDFTGLMELDDWRMVINGKVDYEYTGIGQNQNGMWYIEDGVILYDYIGTYYEGDTAYIIEKNKVCVVVPSNTTKMLEINKEWRMVIDGKVDYSYTGLGENQNGMWYFEAGIITYTYTAEYMNIDGKVYGIVNSKLRHLISVPGYPGTMDLERPIQSNGYISDCLDISGWALSEEKNDKILIYVDGKYIGEATREERADVFEKYSNNEYGGIDSTPLPGFYYNLSTLGLRVGTHTIKIVNLASDGETVMQSREVEINITSLTKSYGIDVSHYQGSIDWNAVKNSGVTFAILKIGEYWCNSGKILFDEYFEANYAACKRLGIAVGGYFYSYAFNSAEAADEANVCLSLIKGKKFDLPIFYDVEDKIIKNGLANGQTDKQQLTNASVTFCNMMINAGHQAGIYASKNFFLDNFVISAIEKFSIWVAHWGISQTDYPGKYDFWQYTSDGIVPGINGRVDLDWYYPKS